MNYFKLNYEVPDGYGRNWYGTLDYAPAATVLLYDDNQGFCVGYMESELPDGLVAMTETEALVEVENAEDIDGVWFGDKLEERWPVPKPPEEVENG